MKMSFCLADTNLGSSGNKLFQNKTIKNKFSNRLNYFNIRKQRNVLMIHATHFKKEHSDMDMKPSATRKEVFYLMTHSTHYIYGYMVSDIWLRTTQIAREETLGHHIGYSFRLAARVLLYAPSHRQDSTYHSLYYTSHDVAPW